MESPYSFIWHWQTLNDFDRFNMYSLTKAKSKQLFGKSTKKINECLQFTRWLWFPHGEDQITTCISNHFVRDEHLKIHKTVKNWLCPTSNVKVECTHNININCLCCVRSAVTGAPSQLLKPRYPRGCSMVYFITQQSSFVVPAIPSLVPVPIVFHKVKSDEIKLCSLNLFIRCLYFIYMYVIHVCNTRLNSNTNLTYYFWKT